MQAISIIACEIFRECLCDMKAVSITCFISQNYTKLHKTRFYTACTLQTCSPCNKPLSNPPASTTHPSLPAMQETWGGVSAACAQGGGYHSCQPELPKEGNLKCWKWSPNVRKSVPHHVQAQLLSTLKSSPERKFHHSRISGWQIKLKVRNDDPTTRNTMNNIHRWLCSSMHIYANLHLYSSTFILQVLTFSTQNPTLFFRRTSWWWATWTVSSCAPSLGIQASNSSSKPVNMATVPIISAFIHKWYDNVWWIIL